MTETMDPEKPSKTVDPEVSAEIAELEKSPEREGEKASQIKEKLPVFTAKNVLIGITVLNLIIFIGGAILAGVNIRSLNQIRDEVKNIAEKSNRDYENVQGISKDISEKVKLEIIKNNSEVTRVKEKTIKNIVETPNTIKEDLKAFENTMKLIILGESMNVKDKSINAIEGHSAEVGRTRDQTVFEITGYSKEVKDTRDKSISDITAFPVEVKDRKDQIIGKISGYATETKDAREKSVNEMTGFSVEVKDGKDQSIGEIAGFAMEAKDARDKSVNEMTGFSTEVKDRKDKSIGEISSYATEAKDIRDQSVGEIKGYFTEVKDARNQSVRDIKGYVTEARVTRDQSTSKIKNYILALEELNNNVLKEIRKVRADIPALKKSVNSFSNDIAERKSEFKKLVQGNQTIVDQLIKEKKQLKSAIESEPVSLSVVWNNSDRYVQLLVLGPYILVVIFSLGFILKRTVGL